MLYKMGDFQAKEGRNKENVDQLTCDGYSGSLRPVSSLLLTTEYLIDYFKVILQGETETAVLLCVKLCFLDVRTSTNDSILVFKKKKKTQ